MVEHRHSYQGKYTGYTNVPIPPKYPADNLTQAEVDGLRALLTASEGGGGTPSPEPNPPPEPPPPDITAPVISSITVTVTGTTTATVAWTTNETTTGVVKYGTTTGYGSQTGSTASGTSHSRNLTGLASGQAYNAQIVATDASGNIGQSTNRTFTTQAAVPPSANPSGQAILPTVTGWPNRLFSDDFNSPIAEGQFGIVNTSTWDYYPPEWHDTSGNGWYGNQVMSVHDGMLDIYLRQISGVWRSAAPIPVPTGGWPRSDARMTVRFKADQVAGWQTSWLFWPQSNVWPRDGEIDFPEGNLNGSISAFMHRQGATSGGDQDIRSTGVSYAAWHTATTEWDSGSRCAFYLDGTLLGSAITSRVPNTPMRFVLQTETRLSGGAPPAGAAAHVYIDWITVDGR